MQSKELSALINEETKLEDMESRGCTANVVLIKGDTIYCANAGDSRAIMGVAGKNVSLSFDHKPTNPQERQRITRAGSTVNMEGRIDGNLNLSRAIGDVIHKRNKRLPLTEQAITSFPDIKIQKITNKTDFIVMGCDGIYESHNN